jgi:hypothetical protein
VHGDRHAEARQIQRHRIELRMHEHRLQASSEKPSAIVAANIGHPPHRRYDTFG